MLRHAVEIHPWDPDLTAGSLVSGAGSLEDPWGSTASPALALIECFLRVKRCCSCICRPQEHFPQPLHALQLHAPSRVAQPAHAAVRWTCDIHQSGTALSAPAAATALGLEWRDRQNPCPMARDQVQEAARPSKPAQVGNSGPRVDGLKVHHKNHPPTLRDRPRPNTRSQSKVAATM